MKVDGRELTADQQALTRRMAAHQRVFDRESPIVVIRSYGLSDRANYPGD